MAGFVVFKELENNLWLFEFEEEDDKNGCWLGDPGLTIVICWY